MNIFDFALQMELDGEKYYRDLAAKTKYDDLKKTLLGLAADERRHYEIILLAENQTFKYTNADTPLAEFKNVFADNAEFTGDKEALIAKLKNEPLDIYQAALIKETESVEIYQKLAERIENPEGKVICEKLMQEEQKHKEVFENLIEMLNHVNDWVEAAEFNHKDLY